MSVNLIIISIWLPKWYFGIDAGLWKYIFIIGEEQRHCKEQNGSELSVRVREHTDTTEFLCKLVIFKSRPISYVSFTLVVANAYSAGNSVSWGWHTNHTCQYLLQHSKSCFVQGK